MGQVRGGWGEGRWLAAGAGLGATSALAQVALLRELLVGFRGNELSLGISLAAWLVWVALGSTVGGALSRPGRSEARLSAIALSTGSLFVLGAMPVAGIWLARDLRGMLGIGWGEFIPASRLVSSAALLIAPVGLAAGMAFPLVCRAAYVRAGVTPGRIYLAESLGFLVGGLASFAAADHVPPFFAALVIVVAAGVTAAVIAWDHRAPRFLAAAWSAAACAAIIAGLPGRLENASLRNLYPGQRIIASRYSRYGNWAALAHAEQVSFYHNGALAFSAPQPMAAETLAHLALLQHPKPRRVLLIGGGVDGTAAEILKHPRLPLDYVELDPAVIALARDCARRAQPHLADIMRHPRLRFYQSDGRLFIKRAAARYDVIIVNLPEPATALLNRFYTIEFFAEAKRALGPDGVLCVGLPGAENYIGPEMQALHGSVYYSLRRVFADVTVTPGEHSYFFASPRRGFLTADAGELTRRWQKRHVPVKYFGPYYIEAILLPERVEFIKQSCESAPRAVNRDFRPVGYFYDVAVTGLAEGLLPPGVVAHMRLLPGPLLAVVAVAMFALPFALSPRGQRLRRGAIIGGIAIVGFAGMTLEVSLLFALQVINGHVYAQVGALVAAFMAGLAVGTWVEARAVARANGHQRRWLAWLAVGCFVTAMTPAALTALAATAAGGTWLPTIVIAALMAAGGAVVGALFPLAVNMLGGSAGAAGLVYAADLVGAALGACLTAVLALPLLGLGGTCYAAAAMVAAIAGMGALGVRPGVTRG